MWPGTDNVQVGTSTASPVSLINKSRCLIFVYPYNLFQSGHVCWAYMSWPLGSTVGYHNLIIMWVVQPGLKLEEGEELVFGMLRGPGQPICRDWLGASCGCSSDCVPLCPSQDWQEIISLYEKDNTYLGKITLRGQASTGEPVAVVLKRSL